MLLTIQDDAENLNFRRNDIMAVMRCCEYDDNWWVAHHKDGRQGDIPKNHVEVSLFLYLYNASSFSVVWLQKKLFATTLLLV